MNSTLRYILYSPEELNPLYGCILKTSSEIRPSRCQVYPTWGSMPSFIQIKRTRSGLFYFGITWLVTDAVVPILPDPHYLFRTPPLFPKRKPMASMWHQYSDGVTRLISGDWSGGGHEDKVLAFGREGRGL